MKFSNPTDKEIIGKGMAKIIQEGLGPQYSLMHSTTQYLGPDTIGGQPRALRRGESPRAGEVPIEGVKFKSKRDKNILGEIVGMAHTLIPNWRKTARVSPIPKLALDKRDPSDPPHIKGYSSLLNNNKNQLQGYQNKFDAYTTNINTGLSLAGTTEDLGWKTYINNILKMTQDQINLLNQNVAYVEQRGGIFYNIMGSQASGRKQVITHAGMQHIVPIRIATIPVKPMKYILSLSEDPDKYNDEERHYVAGAMDLLSGPKSEWNDGHNKSNDDIKWSQKLLRFKQLVNQPDHEARRVAEALKRYSEAYATNPNITPESVGLNRPEMMRWVQGKNDMQGLWSLNEFLKAKEVNYKSGGKMKEFLTPYVGAVDSAINGAMQAALAMGDRQTFRSGGGKTAEPNDSYYSPKHVDKFEADKMYVAAQKQAESMLVSRMDDEPEMVKFAELFFGYDVNSPDLDNFYQVAFVKRAVTGAIYGQMQPGSVATVSELFLKWLANVDTELNPQAGLTYSPEGEYGVTPENPTGFNLEDIAFPGDKFQPKVFEAINTYYGGTIEDPIIYYKERADEITYEPHIIETIEIKEGSEAQEQMKKLAEIIYLGMHTSSPLLQDFTKTMQDIFVTLVELEAAIGDWGLKKIIGKLRHTSVQPDLTSWDDPNVSNKPIYTKKGEPNNWVKATQLDFVSTIIPEENISIPLEIQRTNKALGITEDKTLGDVYFQDPDATPYSSLRTELEAMDWSDPDRPPSPAITKWAVFNLHLGDTAIAAIAMAELERKYPEIKWMYLTFDEIKIDHRYREKASDEYNKAMMAYSSLNNPIINSADELSGQLVHEKDGGIITEEVYKKLMSTPGGRALFNKLRARINILQTTADELMSGTGIEGTGSTSELWKEYRRHTLGNMSAGTLNEEKHRTVGASGDPIVGKPKKVIHSLRRDEEGRITRADLPKKEYMEDASRAERLKVLLKAKDESEKNK
jgi:hypothetical protein